MVTWLVNWRLGGFPTSMYCEVPSKLNAVFTSPGAYAGVPIHVPLLPLMMSMVLFSPCHQLIMFAGGGTQTGIGVGVGVGVAATQIPDVGARSFASGALLPTRV